MWEYWDGQKKEWVLVEEELKENHKEAWENAERLNKDKKDDKDDEREWALVEGKKI